MQLALAGFERMGVVFETALTKEHLAAVATHGNASQLCAEALAAYEQLGAAPHAERVRTGLAAAVGR